MTWFSASDDTSPILCWIVSTEIDNIGVSIAGLRARRGERDLQQKVAPESDRPSCVTATSRVPVR
jgi:hypothetical protein